MECTSRVQNNVTKEQDMRLEQSDAELFYRLWFPLLDFVDRKYHVCPETTIDQRLGVDARDAKTIADHLWSHAEIIEEYLAAAELPEEYAQIVAGWKQCKPGRYILECHLKKVSCSSQRKMGPFVWSRDYSPPGRRCLEKLPSCWMLC